MIELKKGNAMFDQVKFCVNALDTKSDRDFKKVLHIQDGVMNGTDGIRLHQWTECTIEDGKYRVFKNTKTIIMLLKDDEGILYPDISEIFPKEKQEQLLPELPLNTQNNIDLRIGSHAKILRLMKENRAFNFIYLLDLDGIFDVYYYGSEKPIVFVNDKEQTKAAIMPARI